MPLTASKILTEYRRRTPTSEKLAAQARELFPSGVNHDSRYVRPYPIYVDRAAGSRKWDVDGNEYIDYVCGHGALLLGHNHPQVTEAVAEQLLRGTHYGACQELELRWGTRVQQLVPSAEKVRFTSSGTEATLLGFRLARAYTGKSKIVRFLTNFHGWHDHAAFGVASHHDGTPTPGVLPEVAQNILLCPPNDIEAMRRLLDERNDVAAVILEPTGGGWGQVPTPESFLNELREATERRDVVLIFDEVITGFRCSPGGVQAHYGITPDMTTLAKILAGGFPGGAVVGRQDIMDWLDFEASASEGREKIGHQGTFNANPISAAAGAAALDVVATTDACRRANDHAAQLREAFQRALEDANVDWCIYGAFSGFHIFTNPRHESVTPEEIHSGNFDYRKIKEASASPLTMKLRIGMLIHGVDIFVWPGGLAASVHDADDLEQTIEAFRNTLDMLKEDGDV